MGAVPTGLLVALAAPPDLPVTWARDLTEGLAAECARAGATVVGGDTARAGSVLLATTVLGDLAGRAPVLRSGAAPGDLVAVTGPLGHAAAGLALLEAVPPAAAGPDPPAWAGPLVAAHRRPQPPYDAGPQAADLGATAMIDISDGLLADLGHIASASGVLIDLSSDRLSPGEDLRAAARSFFGRTGRGSGPAHTLALAWVLTGGEDHALAATFPPGTALPPRWTVIGTVHKGQGVVVDGRNGPAQPAGITSALAGNPARLDAGGAHVHALGRAAHDHAPALDVRVPAAGGAAVRERDVVAEARPLAADVADGSHGSLQEEVGMDPLPGGSGSRRSLPDTRPRARTERSAALAQGGRPPAANTALSARPSMLPGVTTLREPLTRALGPKTGKVLENAFGMATVGDLLRHYPRRYYTRGELTDLSSLREGDHVTVLARIANVSLHPMPQGGPRMRGEVIITDDRAKLMLTFFFRNPGAQYKFRGLKPDLVGMFAGTVSSFRGRLQLVHPEYELLPGAPPNADLTPELAAEFATELIPVYPASAKASSWLIARSVKTVLDTAGRRGGPAARRAAGTVRAVRAGRGHPGHPPPAGLGRPQARRGPAQVGRGVHAAGRAGPAADGGRRPAGHAPAARAGRHRRRVRRRGCRSPSPRARWRWGRPSRTIWPAPTRCTGCCRARSARARR